MKQIALPSEIFQLQSYHFGKLWHASSPRLFSFRSSMHGSRSRISVHYQLRWLMCQLGLLFYCDGGSKIQKSKGDMVVDTGLATLRLRCTCEGGRV